MSEFQQAGGRVLVVDPDAQRRGQLAAQLSAAGFAIDQIASGLAALTSIERTTPDVVLMHWDAGDMSAAELCTAIRRDDTLARLKSVLVLDPAEEVDRRTVDAAVDGVFDLVVAGPKPIERQLRALIVGSTDGPPSAQCAEQPFELSGTGTFVDMVDVFQLVGARSRTGVLAVGWGDEPPAQIYFDRGRVRHARFQGEQGRSAVLMVFSLLQDRGQARFSFKRAPLREEQEALPRTIWQTAQRLLLDIAVTLDEATMQGVAQ